MVMIRVMIDLQGRPTVASVFPKSINYINAVDFLSITTPILAFAGISVANRLEKIKSISWKIAIVGVFVFIGTYLGSALISQLALSLAGKI